MLNKNKIEEVINNILKEESEDLSDKGIFITEIKVSTDNKITVNIDSMDGVNIKDCSVISRKIENNFDREEEDYELTVSSAGLDQPFKVLKQYQKNIGNQIRLLNSEGKRFKGELIEADENEIVIIQTNTSKKKNNKVTEETIRFKPEDIKEAKVVITF